MTGIYLHYFTYFSVIFLEQKYSLENLYAFFELNLIFFCRKRNSSSYWTHYTTPCGSTWTCTGTIFRHPLQIDSRISRPLWTFSPASPSFGWRWKTDLSITIVLKHYISVVQPIRLSPHVANGRLNVANSFVLKKYQN